MIFEYEQKRRNDFRRNLYRTQDEVDEKKEELIDAIEQRMKQIVRLMELFSIRWALT